jgi:nucleotide-binding universal stress UspA family protein
MEGIQSGFNKKIIIAVDDSPNAERAVAYVTRLLGHIPGFSVVLLHVIDDPQEDFFHDTAEKQQWLADYRTRIEQTMAGYRDRLVAGGFDPAHISERVTVRHCPSLAQCILAERAAADCYTIVVGRQGRSRSEEFLFGSVSSKIVTHAKHCTVWVVE